MTDKNNWTLELDDDEKQELIGIAKEVMNLEDPERWRKIADEFGKHSLKEASRNVLWSLENYIKAIDTKIEAGEKRSEVLGRAMEILNIEKEKPTWIKQEKLRQIKTRIEKTSFCLECYRQARTSLLDMKRTIEELEKVVLKTLEINNQYIEQICTDIRSLCD